MPLGRSAARCTSCVASRDLVRQIPAEWQENVKHRAHQLSYADVPGRHPRPASAPTIARAVVLGRAGDAGHPRPLGFHVARRPSRCTWSPCRWPGSAPDLLWRASPGLRARRGEPRPRGRTDQRLARRRRGPVLRSHQRGARRASCANRPTTAPWSARSWLHQNLSRRRARPHGSLPPDRTSGPGQTMSPPWVAEIESARVRRRRRAGRPAWRRAGTSAYVDPDDATPAEREAVLLASVTAMTVEAARLRAVVEEERPRDRGPARRARRDVLDPDLQAQAALGGDGGRQPARRAGSRSTGACGDERGAGTRGRRSGRSSR